jgi:hypothetical protein
LGAFSRSLDGWSQRELVLEREAAAVNPTGCARSQVRPRRIFNPEGRFKAMTRSSAAALDAPMEDAYGGSGNGAHGDSGAWRGGGGDSGTGRDGGSDTGRRLNNFPVAMKYRAMKLQCSQGMCTRSALCVSLCLCVRLGLSF